jgi:hypothetical protein
MTARDHYDFLGWTHTEINDCALAEKMNSDSAVCQSLSLTDYDDISRYLE